MKWYQVDENEKRRERQHRRKVIDDWKVEAKAIQAADPSKRMLMREAKQLSLARIEDAARTEDDFIKVTQIWDKTEIIEGWRIAKQEENYSPDLPDTELSDLGVVVPQPFEHIYWRQLLNGNFLDAIHDCPHELHEMTASRPVYDFMMDLDDDHREILYYKAIRQWTPQKIATFRGQTDRNIRKVYSNMIADIRKKMYIRLSGRYYAHEPLTYAQREFCKTYWQQLDGVQQNKLAKKIQKEEQRKAKLKASKTRLLTGRADDE